MFTEKWFEPEDGYEDAKAVRDKVFVKEQGYPTALEYDVYDQRSPHLVIYDGEKPVATGRVISDGGKTVFLGRIAVLKEYRGQHLGARLMHSMIARARQIKGAEQLYISAQSYAVPFYEKFGFRAFGEEYLDLHIPHYDMKAAL